MVKNLILDDHYIERIYSLLEKGENQRGQLFRDTLSYLFQK